MDIPSLQAFLAIVSNGSFSLAAEELALTQPAVSKRVGVLEGKLGVKLFHRIGRQVSLTEAGEALLPRAQRLLAELEDTQRLIINLSGQVGGKLLVGTSHHIGLHRLPPALRRFTEHYPDVTLELQFMDSEAACQRVARGDLELGVVTLPPDPSPPLVCQPIWDDPLHLVVAADHALAHHNKIDISQLADVPAIMPGLQTYTRHILDQSLRQAGVIPMVAMSTNYLETIKMMVSVGLGWSVLPKTMLDKNLRALNVKEFKLSRSLGVVRHGARVSSNAALALIGELGA
ncbi:MAG TPA: LysR family transcriptional regulator [Acidiferrobacteraceae bacterium]|nr:LysR family transcriptional regulator [Acidiferrobacteraceae bacterium]